MMVGSLTLVFLLVWWLKWRNNSALQPLLYRKGDTYRYRLFLLFCGIHRRLPVVESTSSMSIRSCSALRAVPLRWRSKDSVYFRLHVLASEDRVVRLCGLRQIGALLEEAVTLRWRVKDCVYFRLRMLASEDRIVRLCGLRIGPDRCSFGRGGAAALAIEGQRIFQASCAGKRRSGCTIVWIAPDRCSFGRGGDAALAGEGLRIFQASHVSK
ncbi:hypothetical protein CLV59_10331 [Chitinophaga dinghuensis]|uniref:Uncharacterized protein n=1 Tax=Chitinophaga dinghuensis TaxID=1539050 RepID=A0A327W4Y3_9BACT|nr:hypothetical protein CLV59_10331 [Chitinophaga dinghuensis]